MSESLEVWEMTVADYLNLLCDKRPSPLDPYVVEANERLASQQTGRSSPELSRLRFRIRPVPACGGKSVPISDQPPRLKGAQINGGFSLVEMSDSL
jgi:hypothetical protein